MKVAKSLPLVATEPHISGIPVFHINEKHSFNCSNSAIQSKLSMLHKGFSRSISESRNMMKSKGNTCDCPHVLIADDDAFQHVCYQNFFFKYISARNLSVQNEDLKVKLFFSAEELLQQLDKVTKCSCSRLRLVILDYYMGTKNLNGIDASVKVRETGYKGLLLLITSEPKKELKSKHKNFDKLFKQKIINTLVAKCDLIRNKEIIQSYMRRECYNFSFTNKLEIKLIFLSRKNLSVEKCRCLKQRFTVRNESAIFRLSILSNKVILALQAISYRTLSCSSKGLDIIEEISFQYLMILSKEAIINMVSTPKISPCFNINFLVT